MTTPASVDTALTASEVARLQRRVRGTLMAGQVLAGLGMGSTLSLGALLAAEVSGTPALSGMAATMATLGAALAAVPLARLAGRAGRAPALATGATVAAVGGMLAIASAALGWFPLLLVALASIGVGTAVNLQSRFAAADLAADATRGRDLSLVVWATTIGAVSGPNLIGPGESLGSWLGLPPLSGAFVFTAIAQLSAAVLYVLLLRPDPLRVAARWDAQRASDAARASGSTAPPPVAAGDPAGVRLAFVAIALSHATMVAVMAMTPVHLTDHGASLVIVGFTISLHIAGMYALAPVFGVLSDRFGRWVTILIGQVLLVASLLSTALGSESEAWVVVGLILLGLGWSAATVAGSALLTESAPPARRTVLQGRSDLVMSGSGAAAGALSGVVLSLIGYSGLSFAALALVVVVVVLLMATPRAGARSGAPAAADTAAPRR
ncbi:putative MFS family arabinose efflux permease [Microcella putealis]|uniref:Putative MFS family arabinose efflux permease n=1 Tax=Microcella putealis TaxID=337005 RepID=A0A4Q7LWV7_9MICO|nr:MFS transporter [Microcella putealis]RZS59505.1 putative MFS family arabinose efflux permease [Microcella putealis]TQM26618.1 putative MFS family arabinose efflux permease [Microcella putealis]